MKDLFVMKHFECINEANLIAIEIMDPLMDKGCSNVRYHALVARTILSHMAFHIIPEDLSDCYIMRLMYKHLKMLKNDYICANVQLVQDFCDKWLEYYSQFVDVTVFN